MSKILLYLIRGGSEIKRKKTNNREEEILDEIRQQVLEESAGLKQEKERLLNEKVNLEALREMTDLPMKRINEISEQVREKYRVRESEYKAPGFLPKAVMVVVFMVIVFLVGFGIDEIFMTLTGNAQARERAKLKQEYSRLLTAVKSGNLPLVKYHITEEKIPVEIDDFYTSALMEAVEGGYPEITGYLIRRGANVLKRSKKGRSVMDMADEGDNVVVRRMVSTAIIGQAPIDSPVRKLAALHYYFSEKSFLKALSKRDRPALELFVAADRGAYSHDYDLKGILTEARTGDLESRRLFNVKGRNSTPKTLLHALVIASGKAHLAIIDYLLERGVDINGKYDLSTYAFEQKFTPLIEALWEDNAAVEHLLRKGADPNLIGSDYALVPLEIPMCAVNNYLQARKRSRQVKMLIRYGADVDKVDGEGRTPLEYAWTLRSNESPYFVKVFLDAGAKVPKTEKAFREMVYINSVPHVKELLDYGVDPDLQGFEYNDKETTALIKSVMLRYYDLVKVLLEYGADVNFRTSRYGKTPLLMAVINEDLPMVRLLLTHGAEVNRDVLYRLQSHYNHAASGDKKIIADLINGRR
ncbi:MAG: ankyrin repeat domain-containing protein [Spirochaetia bacterium]